MFCNLKAELVRKGLEPIKAIESTLECSERTARDRFSGKSAFTLADCKKLTKKFFEGEFTLDYLFKTDTEQVS